MALTEPQCLCRLCGLAVESGRKPQLIAKFATDVQSLLGVDISKDADHLPKHLCDRCRKKIVRHKKEKSKNGKTTAKLNITLCNFEQQTGIDVTKVISVGEEHGFMHSQEETQHTFVKLDKSGLNVSRHVTYKESREWTLYILGKQLDSDSPCMKNIPPKIETMEQCKLLFKAADLDICPGNPQFDKLCRIRHEELAIFYNVNRAVVARESFEDVICRNQQYTQTIRHVNCGLLVNKGESQCHVCHGYRKILFAINSNEQSKFKQNLQKDSTTLLSSKARNDLMDDMKLQAKLKEHSRDRKQLQRKVKDLEIKMERIFKKESVEINENDNLLVRKIFTDNYAKGDNFEYGSAQHLLWQEQRKQLQKPARQMRWHPDVIKWCIGIFYKSPATYSYIRNSGFMTLPHPNTIKKHIDFTDSAPGFNPDVLEKMYYNEGLENYEDYQNNVSLVFDEMKIKSGIAYSKKTGSLVGFCDEGDMNRALSELDARLHGEEENLETATHVLVLMVRGLFSNLKYPIGYYPCTGFDSDQLYPVVWDGVMCLEALGLKVRNFVCDGATPNRKFYRIHGDGERITYKTLHPYDPERHIYMICDVPHLMKTVRNNWENSNWNRKSRKLHYNGQDIKWTQLLQLVEDDVGITASVPGLRLLPKLTYEHLHLNPALRMRVNLAAQVLSSSVAHAFEIQGKPGTEATRKFVSYMDKFFDCLNVKSPLPNKADGTPALQRRRKVNLMPYERVDDPRFEWLLNDFLGFFDEWEASCQAMPGLAKKDKNQMCISRETLEGLRITVHSFVELTPMLLQIPGVKYFLSEKLCQDPLEEHFSKQRSANGNNDNPTISQFERNEKAIVVARNHILPSRNGNFRGAVN